MILRNLKDPRVIFISLAILSLVIGIYNPAIYQKSNGFDLLIIVDITNSMNVRDYTLSGKPASRLDAVKDKIKSFLTQLPCSSNVALGVFTERKPFLLFEPINICSDFYPISSSIDAINWRMAWEGDSRISAGLYRSIEFAKSLKTDLLFFTDGHEAPPLPATGAATFEGKQGEVRGLIVGVGAPEPSPIPKFDENGQEIGFLSADDVPHESRFGLPPKGAEQREGFNARNAPFGAIAATGNEHLSSLKAEYLNELATVTGLEYISLNSQSNIKNDYVNIATQKPHYSPTYLQYVFSIISFLLILLSSVWTVGCSLYKKSCSNLSEYLMTWRKNEKST
jgi:mxaL protein